MSSTARCLAICEIQRNILRHSDHRGTAYNVALTCKTLSSTALDELWRVLSGIQPLLGLFPDDVVVKGRDLAGQYFVSLCLVIP